MPACFILYANSTILNIINRYENIKKIKPFILYAKKSLTLHSGSTLEYVHFLIRLESMLKPISQRNINNT